MALMCPTVCLAHMLIGLCKAVVVSDLLIDPAERQEIKLQAAVDVLHLWE